MCDVVAVAGVLALDDDRRLLLVRRRSDGSWTHPAGRLDAGETWAQAARREFAEEPGGEVRLGNILGVYTDAATQTYTYPLGRRVQLRRGDLSRDCRHAPLDHRRTRALYEFRLCPVVVIEEEDFPCAFEASGLPSSIW